MKLAQLLGSVQRFKVSYPSVSQTVFSKSPLLGLKKMKGEVLCFQSVAKNISLPQSVSGARLVLLNNSQSVSNLEAYPDSIRTILSSFVALFNNVSLPFRRKPNICYI